MPAPIVDYYEVLSVDPQASVDEIKRAFRREALRWHPDRGGSHDRMVLVAEAWEVLSDPQLRAEYDRVRSSPREAELSSWVDRCRPAAERASAYPRRWDQFVAWMDSVSKDIRSAEYGLGNISGEESSTSAPLVWFWGASSPFTWFWFPNPRWFTFPAVAKSISGRMAVLLGAAIGLVISAWPLWSPFKSNVVSMWVGLSASDGRSGWGHLVALGFIVFVVALAANIGAWCGCSIHRRLRDRLTRKTHPHCVVDCPSCGQRSNLPVLNQVLEVTCPSCHHRFTSHESLKAHVKHLEDRMALLQQESKWLGMALFGATLVIGLGVAVAFVAYPASVTSDIRSRLTSDGRFDAFASGVFIAYLAGYAEGHDDGAAGRARKPQDQIREEAAKLSVVWLTAYRKGESAAQREGPKK